MPPKQSFGVVIFNEDGHVLLRKVTNDFGGARWTFAKGKPNAGETPEQAAVREAREETGYEVELGKKLDKPYQGTTGETVYFVARVKPGTTQGKHDWETERTAWLPPERAVNFIKTSPDPVVVKRDLAVFADGAQSWLDHHQHWHKGAPKKKAPKQKTNKEPTFIGPEVTGAPPAPAPDQAPAGPKKYQTKPAPAPGTLKDIQAKYNAAAKAYGYTGTKEVTSLEFAQAALAPELYIALITGGKKHAGSAEHAKALEAFSQAVSSFADDGEVTYADWALKNKSPPDPSSPHQKPGAPASQQPPPGFTPILHSKHGGWHKLIGDHWEQWYAKTPDKRNEVRNATFPADLSKLKHVKSLGGSTGASLVEDEHGRQFVKKQGSHSDHLREEYTADEAYRALNVPVPPSKLYDDGKNPPTKLAVYLEGARKLGEVLQEGDFDLDAAKVSAKARATLAKGFVADVLLGSWDVTGLDNDNVLVHKDGTAYRIDNGGSLRYRAQGAPKGAAWNEHPTEVFTMRHHGEGPSNTSKNVFSHIGVADIQKAVKDITPRLMHLNDALFHASKGSELINTVLARFKNLSGAVQNAKTEDEFKANLKKNGAKW